VAATDADPVARWNHPRWWIDRLRQDHPGDWQRILEANNTHPAMSLRVNVRRSTRDDWLQSFAVAGIDSRAVGEYGIVLDQPRPVHAIPGFDEGVVSVQDAAAQLAAPLLLDGLRTEGDRPLRILDACAAPGGKTAHLLELANAHVTALDISPERCERIAQTLQRLGLQEGARVLAADAAQPEGWWDGTAYDAILLDAPCTASGIVRRHPDVRWLRRPTDVGQLAAIQYRLLKALWPLLKPQGRLLYCTCSVFRAEGEAQVQTFVAHNNTAVLKPTPGHLLPQSGAPGNGVPDNLAGDHDGFFYALLEKSASP
jgi:16S rRNA (cytosine967-C5)-methyltransferase